MSLNNYWHHRNRGLSERAQLLDQLNAYFHNVGLSAQARIWAVTGSRLEAIKNYRLGVSCGLKAAKDTIDLFFAYHLLIKGIKREPFTTMIDLFKRNILPGSAEFTMHWPKETDWQP